MTLKFIEKQLGKEAVSLSIKNILFAKVEGYRAAPDLTSTSCEMCLSGRDTTSASSHT
jgi:hypothetical protein